MRFFEAKLSLSMSLIVLMTGISGCAHNIAFQDINYSINAKKYDRTVLVVIDEDSLNEKVSIRSFMAGIANRWDAQPGQMLKQVADVEIPQMFKGYEFSTTYKDPT